MVSSLVAAGKRDSRNQWCNNVTTATIACNNCRTTLKTTTHPPSKRQCGKKNAQPSCVATRAMWECSAVACARGFPLCLMRTNNPYSWRALIIEKVVSPLRFTFSRSVSTRPRAGRVGAQRLRVAGVYPNEYSADAWSAPPRHTCGIRRTSGRL